MTMRLEIADNLFIYAPSQMKIFTVNFNHSQQVREFCSAFTIEASAEVLPSLQGNISTLGNVSVRQFAVAGHRGFTDLYLTDGYVNSGVSETPLSGKVRKINVLIEILDHWYCGLDQRRERVDFIKCDVQGDDVVVFNVAREMINDCKHLNLVIE